MGFFRRNRDAILVALLAGAAVVVLDALLPDLRDAAAKGAAAGWLVRPTSWPPLAIIGFILAAGVLSRAAGRRAVLRLSR